MTDTTTAEQGAVGSMEQELLDWYGHMPRADRLKKLLDRARDIDRQLAAIPLMAAALKDAAQEIHEITDHDGEDYTVCEEQVCIDRCTALGWEHVP